MAVSLGNNPRIKGSRRKANISAEINVTPLVDVMLVLLVIFMVTAPLLTVGVPVDLPKTKASVLNEKDDPLEVTVNSQGILYLQEVPLELPVLLARLVAITGTNPEARIYVKADQGLPYGKVMEILGAISSAGFQKVALRTESPQGKPPSISQVKADK